MESFILDFDLQGENHVITVEPHHEQGAAFYRALINEDHAVDYYRQENGVLQPVPGSKVNNELVNAIAVHLMEHLNKGNGHGFKSVP